MAKLAPKDSTNNNKNHPNILKNLVRNKVIPQNQKNKHKKLESSNYEEKPEVLEKVLTNPKIYILLEKTFSKIMLNMSNKNSNSNGTIDFLQDIYKIKRSFNANRLKQIMLAVDIDQNLTSY